MSEPTLFAPTLFITNIICYYLYDNIIRSLIYPHQKLSDQNRIHIKLESIQEGEPQEGTLLEEFLRYSVGLKVRFIIQASTCEPRSQEIHLTAKSTFKVKMYLRKGVARVSFGRKTSFYKLGDSFFRNIYSVT